MKAGIKNNSFKPLPISPLMGAAAISGGASLAGGIFGGITAAVEGKKQRQHDKEMAALNQKYALEQMEQQNTYQVEQWNRENDYNDPSAVRQRYEAAGISPHAAMGSGAANGAGIAGGLSSAPSGSGTGHSSSLPSAANSVANSIVASVSNALQAQRIEAQNKESEAKAKLDEQKARLESLRVAREQFLQDNGDLFRELNEKGWRADVAQIEAFKSSIDKNWYRIEKQQAFDIKQSELDLLGESLRKYDAEIDKLVSEKKLTEQQAQNLKDENRIIQERYNTQVAVTDKEKELADEVRKKGNVHDAEVEKLTAQVYQEWVRIGIDGAQVIMQIVDILSPILRKSPAKVTQTVEEIVTRNGKGNITRSTTKTKSSVSE